MNKCLEDTAQHKKSIIISSNRGPVTFTRNSSGELVTQRGSGGLVTALKDIVGEINATWISCALTQEDTDWKEGMVSLAETGDQVLVKFISPNKEEYEGYYNVIANPLLWFLQHSMWNLPNAPIINQATWKAWKEGYTAVNRQFAEAIRNQLDFTPKPALVMLQDYHQYLVAKFLRESIPARERPTILHFSHIPWPGPEYWRILPPAMRQDILVSMCAADILGFQTKADVLDFLRTCQTYMPRASVKYKPQRIWYRNHATYVREFPISIDVHALRAFAQSEEVLSHQQDISNIISNRKLILRIDRIEPSKNIVRGFKAFEELLTIYPEQLEKVSFLALLVPSRMDVKEYKTYLDDLMAAAGHVNATFGTPEWEPIRVLVGESYPRAIAALKHYDVLLVNSIADGMNLVAKEGPIVNQRDGVLVLSERTGAQEQLGVSAITISPCDVYATAEAIYQGLIMPANERRERSERLRWIIEKEDIHDWFCKQLDAVEKLTM
ncbi:MAG: trehalose-6-phosphate synthase [Anaerolineales bacterium]|nr:trehalose-6-phosphate synthase [Anaerolineales bacterium]